MTSVILVKECLNTIINRRKLQQFGTSNKGQTIINNDNNLDFRKRNKEQFGTSKKIKGQIS